MLPSRLSQIAADLVRRTSGPQVLDYARPEPPRSRLILARVSNEIEYRGGAWCVGLFAVGVLMAVIGFFLIMKFGLAVVAFEGGLAMVALSRIVRGVREMDV